MKLTSITFALSLLLLTACGTLKEERTCYFPHEIKEKPYLYKDSEPCPAMSSSSGEYKSSVVSKPVAPVVTPPKEDKPKPETPVPPKDDKPKDDKPKHDDSKKDEEDC